MGPELKSWLRAGSKGLGQVAFCDYWLAGLLILAALAVVSPLHAVAGAIGAAAGTGASRVLRLRTVDDWREGLAGANPAIVGIIWAGLFEPDLAGFAILAGSLAVCILLDGVAARAFARLGLPPLASAAMVTVYLLYLAHVALGQKFWPPLPPFPGMTLELSVVLAIVCVALAIKSFRAMVVTTALTAAAALGSGLAFDAPSIGPVALWGFAVAPAVFASHGVFLAGSVRGAVMALAAGACAAGLWFAWTYSPLGLYAPPLLIPFMAAVWGVVYVSRRFWGEDIQNPLLWFAATKLRDGRRAGRPALLLTGAGVSTGSGIPDYVSGAWLDEDVPQSTYRFDRYLASPRARRAYWNSCFNFLRRTRSARPNAAHRAIAALEGAGFAAGVVTQNVDALHQNAGSREVIELHGRIDHIHCLSCGETSEWPAADIWQRYDLRCHACKGLLKPAVIALGEPIPPDAWQVSQKVLENCGSLIVVGTQLAISSAAQLVHQARKQGTRLIVVNTGATAIESSPGDIVIQGKAERILPALARLLDCRMPAG